MNTVTPGAFHRWEVKRNRLIRFGLLSSRSRSRKELPVNAFDHERLDVYQVAIDFVVLADNVVEHLPRGRRYLAPCAAGERRTGNGNGNEYWVATRCRSVPYA